MITKMSNFNVASVKQILLASLDLPNTSQQSILISCTDASTVTKVSLRKPTKEEDEEMAKQCENFCKIFPERSLTRKMIELSLVMPTIIRRERPGMINKILRLEQEGEHIHAVINRLERNLTMTTNKSTRYWQVLREYENKIYNGVK